MKKYMLDTNTVSHLVRNHPAVAKRVIAAPMGSLCISAITEGELLFGVAKRPHATRLQAAVQEFLRRVDVLPWNSATASRYGAIRASMESRGKTLAALDMLIASHALDAAAILVTNDRAFAHIDELSIEDWTA